MKVKKQVKNEPIFLFVDEPALNIAKSKENNAINLFKNIKDLCIKALADAPINYNRLVEYGGEILVDAYFKAYVKNHPEHLNRNIRFQNETDIQISLVDASINEFKNVNTTLRQYALKVGSTGELISNINEADFKRYLNENKRTEYEALVNYVNAIKQLEKTYLSTEQRYQIAINRAEQRLQRDGFSLKVRLTDFI